MDIQWWTPAVYERSVLDVFLVVVGILGFMLVDHDVTDGPPELR